MSDVSSKVVEIIVDKASALMLLKLFPPQSLYQ